MKEFSIMYILLLGVIYLTVIIMLFPVKGEAYTVSNRPILTERNTNLVYGKIYKVKANKNRTRYTVDVVLYDAPYDGNIYRIKLGKADMRKWIKRNKKTTVIMYNAGTKSIYDDEIVNIRKGWR